MTTAHSDIRVRRRRRMRTAAWLCFASAGLVLAVVVGSQFAGVAVYGKCGVACGVLYWERLADGPLLRFEPIGSAPLRHRLVIAFGFRPDWMVDDIAFFPLWVPAFLFLVAGAVLLIRSARPGPGHCPSCSYDLTGNVSGICSECGRKLDSRE